MAKPVRPEMETKTGRRCWRRGMVQLRCAWAPVWCRELTRIDGAGGGWPEWSGDGSLRRREVVFDGDDLE